MQWDSILASERGTDTTQWVEENMGGNVIWTISPFFNDRDTPQTIYMRPVRFGVFGATETPEEYNPSYLVDNERLYSAPKTVPPTAESRHTFNIMPHIGMIPTESHCGPIVLTSVEYDVPGMMDYLFRPIGSSSSSAEYGAFVDAARLWVNGDDITGIISDITPPISFVNNVLNLINDQHFDFKSGAKLQFTLASPVTLNPDDLIYIDIWYKITIGDGWLPRLQLRSLDAARTDLNPGFFRYSDSRTRPVLIPDAEDSINLAVGYVWHVTLSSASVKAAKSCPWSVIYPEDTPWTFGDYGDINLQSPPSSTEYSTIVRPFVSVTVFPAAAWDVTTVGNIDDSVLQPAAGDGVVCSYGPSALAPDIASGRWNFGVSGTQPVVKVVVWYRARCDSNSDGSFTNIQLRYTSAGVLRVRNKSVTTAITSTFAWYSAEFTGTDISGFASVTSCQVQIDAALATVDGFVELDVLYVDIQREGDVTVTSTDTSRKLVHANGEEISFQWGREVPEIILGRRSSSIPGSLIVGSGHPVRALYKPRDTGTYFSGGLMSPTEYLESAGVWSPNEDTDFVYWGVVLGNVTLYGREVFQFENNLRPYFPEIITIRKN